MTPDEPWWENCCLCSWMPEFLGPRNGCDGWGAKGGGWACRDPQTGLSLHSHGQAIVVCTSPARPRKETASRSGHAQCPPTRIAAESHRSGGQVTSVSSGLRRPRDSGTVPNPGVPTVALSRFDNTRSAHWNHGQSSHTRSGSATQIPGNLRIAPDQGHQRFWGRSVVGQPGTGATRETPSTGRWSERELASGGAEITRQAPVWFPRQGVARACRPPNRCGTAAPERLARAAVAPQRCRAKRRRRAKIPTV